MTWDALRTSQGLRRSRLRNAPRDWRDLRLRGALVSIVLIILGVLPTPAVNAEPTITEFMLRRTGSPISITAGPDGNLWFTEGNGNQIGRITPDGSVTEFPDPGGGHPWGITAGPDGNIWYTDLFQEPCCGAKIGRLTPPPQGRVIEFAIEKHTHNPRPLNITSGPDGNLWFTLKDRIGRISPTGRYKLFDAPSGFAITVGPDGNLWFTHYGAISRITLSGEVTTFPVPGMFIRDIVTGPDGNLWFALFTPDAIGRMTPEGDVTLFALPSAESGPYGIAAGPDGNLWFTEYLANRIGRITVNGDITEYPVPSPNAGPLHITAGPDGNMWFTEKEGNRIGRVNL